MLNDYTNYTILNQESTLDYTSEYDASIYLKDPSSFRTFDKGLIELLIKKGYSANRENINDMTDYLFSKLRDINSTVSKKTVLSWLSGERRPKIEAGYRQRMYEICFALNLTAEETIWFFHHVYYARAFNCHIIDEAVFYYAFLNNLPYSEALKIIDTVNASKPNADAVDGDPYYTNFIQKRISEFKSINELEELLISNKNNFNSWNKSALRTLNGLIDELKASEAAKKDIDKLKDAIRGAKKRNNKLNTINLKINNYDQCGLIMKELFYDAKHDENNSQSEAEYILEAIDNINVRSNDFLLERLLSTYEGFSKRAVDIPYAVLNSFPSKSSMSGVLSEAGISKSKSYDAIRKMIVLLDFYSFWVQIKIGENEIDLNDISKDDLFNIYLDEANTRLNQCGYEDLYAGNPYDWIFLCSARNDEPLNFFRSCIEELLPW